MNNFNDFMKKTFENLECDSYLEDLFSNIELFTNDFIERKSPRLIVNMPPRSLKSESISIRLPAYLHSKNPKLNIGVFVANQDLANHFACKNSCIYNKPNNIKYIGISNESIDVLKFDIIIIDDTIRSSKESESLKFKFKTHTFIKKLLEKHLNPYGGFINVQSRWSNDDTTGYLIDVCNDHDWKVLKYLALNSNNEPLTNRFEYKKIKKNINYKYFQALYQQDPIL